MNTHTKAKRATCRVDGDSEQLGTAFWISEQHLLTADHVAGANDDLRLTTNNGDVLEGEIVKRSEDSGIKGADVALLRTSVTPDDVEILSISPTIPEIGSEVIWSGYARLFGEDEIERQRLGWGRVASEPYRDLQGLFFEVDGLFNPGHSGGPVIVEKTGDVVGVVSASAGDFEKLTQEWTERVKMLQELFKLQQSGGMLFRTFTYDDPKNAIHDQSVFQQLGLSVESKTDDDGRIQLKINTEEIPIAAGKFQAEMGKLLLDTAIATFQMGVGIASGGEPLKNFVPNQ